MALKTDYKDYIPPSGGRKYKITANSDGSSSVEDITQYQQVGDTWGAEDINQVNKLVNGAVYPNLLDNSDFTNPVNQRNGSGTISASGYFIDRWKLVSGTVQITANGLVLNGIISQILENAAGTDVTASASAGTASYDNSTKTFTLTATGQTITWAKLEKGSVATPYVPKGYGAELAECQRYFKRVGNRGFRGWATNETNVVCCLTLATQMRVKPTITPVGTLTAYDEVSGVTVTMDSSTGSTVDTARITAHGTGLTAFRTYSLLGNVDISADL